MKLNPTICAFRVPQEKLLGFIVSRRGTDLDPFKIKKIRDLRTAKSMKEVMSFLGRINYISRLIHQSTVICEPIFKLLQKTCQPIRPNNVKRLFTTSRVTFQIHQYWCLNVQDVHCYRIYLSVTMHLGVCWENIMRPDESRELCTT